MKGVILSANPEARIVDLTHQVPPQDIQAGAFNLLACYQDFPAGTIHIAVVDPGVGSNRRAIVLECAGRLFVGPDNGLFSWICEREAGFHARELTNDKFFRHPVSPSFHGRDVFAPVAAALAAGVDPAELGNPIDDIVRLESITPRTATDGTIEGRISHIDRFGNCITNLTRAHLPGTAARLSVGTREIISVREFFSSATSPDELFMIIGSAGFVELSARNAAAASILDARRGQPIILAAPQSI